MLSAILEQEFRDSRNNVVESDIAHLRSSFPWIPATATNEDIEQLVQMSVSLFQQKKQVHGCLLEDIISSYLSHYGIRHFRQVPVDSEGRVCSKECSKTLVDFVISAQALCTGQHVRELVVLSAKKSCRERWLQDEWTRVHAPKMYILLTLSPDYPDPRHRFKESPNRLIITLRPKKKDTRRYKLGVDHLRHVLRLARIDTK